MAADVALAGGPLVLAPAPSPRPEPRYGLLASVIGVMLTLMVQSAGIVWWASGIEHRVATLESDHKDAKELSIQVGKLEQKVSDLIDMLKTRQRVGP